MSSFVLLLLFAGSRGNTLYYLKDCTKNLQHEEDTSHFKASLGYAEKPCLSHSKQANKTAGVKLSCKVLAWQV